jgi:hypothetical protein
LVKKNENRGVGNLKKYLITILMLCSLLLSFASAEIYNIDPCAGTTLEHVDDEYVYGNDCIEMIVSDSEFDQNFEVNNYIDDVTFAITMQGITEESPLNDSEIEFDSLNWTVDVSSGHVEYVSDDGIFRVGYIINSNTFKSVATITNYDFIFNDSTLWVKNLVKKSKENDTITFVEPIVDGSPIPVDVDVEVIGQNTFYWQDVGRGSLIEIDPIYFVDYSPTPATRLINGDVDLWDDSAFPSIHDVTTGVSDNLTATQYGALRHTPSYPSFIWYKEQAVDDTAKISAIGGTVSNLHIEYADTDYGRILMQGGKTLKNGDVIRFYMQPKASGDTNKVVYLKDPTDSVTYGTFNTGTDTSSYNWREVTLTNIASPITQIYVHDNTLTSGVDIDIDYMQVVTYNESGSAFSLRWSQTYNAGYQWYLAVKKETAGTHTGWVYGYLNSDDLAVAQKTSQSLAGTGWFYIPVDSIMNFEKNTQGLTFTQLRFFPMLTANISEFRLRSVANDTAYPSVTNCLTAKDLYGCNETIYLNCTVTDDNAVAQVKYNLDGTNVSASQCCSDTWVYEIENTGYDDIYYNWSYAYGIDLFGNTNETFVNETFRYLCVEACVENWVEDAWNCTTNDTYFRTYTDLNDCNTTVFLPATNGTYQYCNYCSEDLEQILGDCQITNNQTVDYIDYNQYTCCAVTNLSSDCSILYYPYNETTSQFCYYYSSEMGAIQCQNEPNFNLREKEYCLAYIPAEYLDESFKCIAHVYDINTDEILQTNPEYKEARTSFLDLLRSDPETREWFTPAGAIVNFYYTQKNLLPEHDYVLTIQCSSPDRTLTSKMPFQIAYEDYEGVFFRTRWFMANAPYIIGGIIVLFLIIAVLWWIYRSAF